MRILTSIFFLLSLTPLLPTIASAEEQAIVINVIDGDTLYVQIRKSKEYIRLIGIDSPESTENPKALRDAARSRRDLNTIIALGRQAANHLKSLVRPRDKLYLEFDREKRDRYRRLLVYAFRPDGKMLNEQMLLDGYAQLMTIQPNVRYLERFKRAQTEARRNRRGLWGDINGL